MDSSRRTLLKTGTAVGAAGLIGAFGTPLTAGSARADQRPSAAAPNLRSDPFTLGVASGDPAPDGFVLWTRLAPEPLAPDGLGGMPNRNTAVRWEVAVDPRFRLVVRRGSV